MRLLFAAMLLAAQLHCGFGGKRVLPVFYRDNDLSLAPGETRIVTIEAATRDLQGKGPWTGSTATTPRSRSLTA